MVEQTTTLIIRDLTLTMLIGVYDYEKEKPQTVLINAQILVNNPENWETDSMNGLVSYADLVDDIKSIAAKGHINTVEAFAEDIAQAFFARKGVQETRIRVEKPEIIAEAAAVGVEIVRQRPAG